MDDTNSDDSLYNFLINDCGRSPAAAATAVERCKTASDKQRLRRRRYRCPCPRSRDGTGGVDTTTVPVATTTDYDRQLNASNSSFEQPVPQRQHRQHQHQQQPHNGRSHRRRVNRCREEQPSREPCSCGHAEPPPTSMPLTTSPPPPPPPPPPQPHQSPYVVSLAGQWVRTVVDWTWDKKWYFVTAAASFVLGMYFEDYCQCLYYYVATDDECGD